MHIVQQVAVGVLLGFAVLQAANIATTVYLHRAFAHKGLQLTAPVQMAFRAVIWFTTGIRPGEWVAEHRVHHQHTDEPGDPHSPYLVGIRTAVRENGRLYREWLDNHPDARQMFKDTRPDKWDRLIFDRSKLGLPIGITVGLLATRSIIATVVLSFIHARLYLRGGGYVNGLCHWLKGYQNYLTNKARNIWWVALLTAGEGLHNNHHGEQNNPRLWRKWWEYPLDIGWWACIKPLLVLRLAKLRPVKSVTATIAA